jgi:hypothetical protein
MDKSHRRWRRTLCPQPRASWVRQPSTLGFDWDRSADHDCCLSSRRDFAVGWLKIVLAHQASDFLVIDDHASMPQLGANAPPAIEFEPVADRRDRLNDHRALGRHSAPFDALSVAQPPTCHAIRILHSTAGCRRPFSKLLLA